MKFLQLVMISLISMNADAAYKCVINGKTTYSHNKCKGESKPIRVDKYTNWTVKKLIHRPVDNLDPKIDIPVEDNSTTSYNKKSFQEKTDVSRNNKYSCDGRHYCAQMTSCEEASYFLQNCPDPKMDGDFDGVPCEDQWCNN